MHPVQIILVPQGAEYRAVCQGLKQVVSPPTVLPVPVGPAPIRRHLEQLHQKGHFVNQPKVLMMGLCGSLVPDLNVGDIVLYQESITRPTAPPLVPGPRPPLTYDRPLTAVLHQQLGDRATLVKAITSDRVICAATEKRSLAQGGDVVDMEGYTTLGFFSQLGISVATLRVVSDDCHHDLPDLSTAFNREGNLQAGKVAISMLRQPLAAARLIQGSFKGLKVLQNTTAALFLSR